MVKSDLALLYLYFFFFYTDLSSPLHALTNSQFLYQRVSLYSQEDPAEISKGILGLCLWWHIFSSSFWLKIRNALAYM